MLFFTLTNRQGETVCLNSSLKTWAEKLPASPEKQNKNSPAPASICSTFNDLAKSTKLEALYLLRQVKEKLPEDLAPKTEGYDYRPWKEVSGNHAHASPFLKQRRFSRNPFGPEQAELEDPEFFVDPISWTELEAERSSLDLGAFQARAIPRSP